MTLENKILFLLLGKTYFSAVFRLFSLFYCTCNCFSYFCKVIYNFLYFILLFQIKIAHLADGNCLDVYRPSRCPSYGFQLVIRLLLLVHTSTTVQRGLKIFSYLFQTNKTTSDTYHFGSIPYSFSKDFHTTADFKNSCTRELHE